MNERSMLCPPAVLLVALALSSSIAASAMSGRGNDESSPTRAHAIRVHCDDQHDGAECTHEIEIDALRDDHRLVWVGGGPHGHHLTMHSSLAGRGAFLGVHLTDLTPELRRHFGVDEQAGVMVSRVLDDTAAFRAGLAVGDIITAVDGQTVGSSLEVAKTIRRHDEGDTVLLEIWRDGSTESVSATLDESSLRPAIGARRILVDCVEGDEDCDVSVSRLSHSHLDPICPGAERCEIEIRCDAGECRCSVNDDAVDCAELPGFLDPSQD